MSERELGLLSLMMSVSVFLKLIGRGLIYSRRRGDRSFYKDSGVRRYSRAFVPRYAMQEDGF